MCLLLSSVCVTHTDTQRYRDAVHAWRLKDLLLMSERAAYYHLSAETYSRGCSVCLCVDHIEHTHTVTDVTGYTQLWSSVFQYRMTQGHFFVAVLTTQTLHTCHLGKHRLCCLRAEACY